jgi:UDP-N-acetylglucosamine 1-carboxyvinyltransferase
VEKFVIEGGHRLAGTVRPGGSKNEALPVLAATLLTDETVTIHNVPKIQDVLVMLDIIAAIGGKVEWHDDHTVLVNCTDVHDQELPADLSRKLRASILLAGPLLARFGHVKLSPPGGDVIGRRRLDTHFMGLSALGAQIDINGYFELSARELHGADIFLDEPSVTGTENIIIAASHARGTTVIRNAACEPHVQGLCRMLTAMGARMSGIGTNTLTIDGTRELWGCKHNIGPDYLEIGSLIGLAACTHSALTIEGVMPDDLRMVKLVFAKLGVDFTVEGTRVVVPENQELRVRSEFLGQIPKIDDAPWPMFPTDMMSIAITIATQVDGTMLFFEKMFDGRMFFTDSLVTMGAKIILCDPHRVVVNGPSPLVGVTLESPDVRAGMALLIASLCARGTSTIYNIRQIDRGYEAIDAKLRGLGAKIERQQA